MKNQLLMGVFWLLAAGLGAEEPEILQTVKSGSVLWALAQPAQGTMGLYSADSPQGPWTLRAPGDPRKPMVTLAASGDRDLWILSGEEAPFLISHSANQGQTWAAARLMPQEERDRQLLGAEMHFLDREKGWILTHTDAGMSHDYVALYTTKDGGRTWQTVFASSNEEVPMHFSKTGLAFSADLSEALLTGDPFGIAAMVFLYASFDGGQTWRPVALPNPPGRDLQAEDAAIGVYDPQWQGPGRWTVEVRDRAHRLAWTYMTKDDKTWVMTSKPYRED